MEIPGYRIQRLIGKGGMATVYLAIQESLHRPVVLKILDQVADQRSEDLIERFIAEGRIIASLRHPNIITIYDIGLAESSLYISMEYVQGGDLKQRMELPISVDETLEYLIKVAGALAEAHKHGVVHRDVKPANILFRDGQTPLLTDFGIAKQVDTEADLTSTGIFLGSPNYVSPEQADGIKTDGRADIYSLGCIFHELLTGKKPFISNSVIDIIIQHKQAPIPRLPADCADMQPLLDRMMAKRREDRFPDAEALIQAIKKIIDARRRAQHLSESGSFTVAPEITGANRQRRAKQILGALLLLGMVMFSSLKYVEIRLKAPSVRPEAISPQAILSTAQNLAPPGAGLGATSVATPEATSDAVALNNTDPTQVSTAPATDMGAATPDTPASAEVTIAPELIKPPDPSPAPTEVTQALLWLGKKSLEEYKLTFPPKDNAYYYFNRLLELDPGNQTAVTGILEIANSYALLAENSLARDEMDKTAAYVDIGLRINPDNEALLTLKKLINSGDQSLMSKIKNLFSKR